MTESRTGRILEPVERVSEVIFGLIMVLTFTGSISAATAGREEIRLMVFGAIGCNLAWGIVDAAMYLLYRLVERSRAALQQAAHTSGPPANAQLTRQDARGALAVFLLVFISTFPIVIPFFVFPSTPRLALRVSNGIALTMLYLGGHVLGRHAGLPPVRLGMATLGIGLVLVLITIALGG